MTSHVDYSCNQIKRIAGPRISGSDKGINVVLNRNKTGNPVFVGRGEGRNVEPLYNSTDRS